MHRSFLPLFGGVVAVLGSAALATTALPYSAGFENPPFNSGTIGGQDGWTFPSGSPAATGTVTNAAAHSGTQSLLVAPVAGDGNVVKISTPLFDPAGETPSIYVPAPPSDFMATDFWFRTATTSTDPGLYVSTSMGNPASVRNTWLGVLSGAEVIARLGDPAVSGNLYVGAISYDASGNELDSFSPALAWGQWYHARVAEQYVNGPNNDLVTYSLADAGGPVWSTTIGSWENYYATDNTVEQSPGPVVSNRASFGGTGSDGGQGIYVDDLSISVPEPASLSLLALGGLALIRRRRSA